MLKRCIGLYSVGAILVACAPAQAQATAAPEQDSDAARCTALKGIELGPDISVTNAALVRPPFKVSEPDYGSGEMTPPPATTKPFCRVEVLAKPDQSEIHYEAWLPVPANWNGRFTA